MAPIHAAAEGNPLTLCGLDTATVGMLTHHRLAFVTCPECRCAVDEAPTPEELFAENARLRRELDALREAARDVLHLPTSSAEDAAILFTEGMSGPVHPPEVYEEARERQAIRERASTLARLARPG